MLLLSSKKPPVTDEENSLCVESIPTSRYGAIQGQHQPSSDESSSRGNSDAEEGGSSRSSIVKRKKRRMEQRHCCRPKASTRLSSILHQKDSSSDEVSSDLVLPALDPK
jgi:hypothetical protein